MINLIATILIASLACTGFHILYMVRMPLFKIRVLCDAYAPVWVRKPLYDCLPCMTSLYGIPMLIILMEFPPITDLIIPVLATLGLNGIISLAILPKQNDPEELSFPLHPDGFYDDL